MPPSRTNRHAARSGVTLLELVVTCTLVGLVAGIAFPRAAAVLDALRLQQASHEVAGALTLARAAAIRRAAYTSVVIDAPRGELRIESRGDTLYRRDLRRMHHVHLNASRDTITYAPSGLGYGIANSTIVVSIGARAETVTVSRLGRMRRTF